MDVEECAGPLESVLSAQLPGHADGTDRRAVAGSGAPLKPPPGGASGFFFGEHFTTTSPLKRYLGRDTDN